MRGRMFQNGRATAIVINIYHQLFFECVTARAGYPLRDSEMKSKRDDSTTKREVPGEDRAKQSKKILKRDSEKMHIQYPPKVGYHGTDEEKELSPEE
jgi:hypothetical protein